MLDDKYAKKLITQTLLGLGKEGVAIATLFTSDTEDCRSAIANRAMPDVAGCDFPRAYAAWSLLRKSTLLEHGVDKSDVAKAAFDTTEFKCHLVNNHNGTKASDSVSKSVGESVIFYAQRKVADVLGEFCLEEFFDSCSHSGGASTQRKRSESSIKNKWSDVCEITLDAAAVYSCFQSTSHVLPKAVRLVEGAQAFTVPKDAKTDRLIFKEPQGNMFLQKGLGKMIRRRLRRHDIDLNDQHVNQKLASDCSNATIDLSNASNLISRETVRMLLSLCDERWFYMLNTTRSKAITFDNTEYRNLEMFSGMGNGFTFELESLLFYSLAYGALRCERDLNGYRGKGVISIYGDDIIVDCPVYDTLTVGLQYCGFEVNALKSYHTGDFRESCGKHYYAGRDISPVYLKDRKFDQLQDWYYLYNTLQDLNSRFELKHISEVLSRIRKYLKKLGFLYYVPKHFSRESGLHASFDVATPPVARKPRRRGRPWYQSFTCVIYAPVMSTYRVDEMGAYVKWLREAKPHKAMSSILRVWALQFEAADDPVYKVYRPGSETSQTTQGENEFGGTYQHRKVEIPLGAWDID